MKDERVNVPEEFEACDNTYKVTKNDEIIAIPSARFLAMPA